MSYTTDDVTLGRRLVEQIGRSQWDLGDLAVKVAGDADRSVLGEFAEQIGMTGDLLAEYRAVAAAWPQASRVAGASYTLHRTLRTDEDRERKLREYVASTAKPSWRGLQVFLGKTPTPEWSRANRDDQVRAGLADMSPDDRAAAARDLLADPDVADRVMSDPGTRDKAIRAVSRAHEHEDLHRSRREPADDRELGLEGYREEMIVVTMRLRAARRALLEAVEVLAASPYIHDEPEYQEGVRAMVVGMRNRLDLVDSVVSGRPVDAELADLLDGGDDR